MSESNQVHYTAPQSVEAVQDWVKTLQQAQQSAEVMGAGTSAQYGRSLHCTQQISTCRIQQLVDYVPAELMVVVQPGMPLKTLESLLAEQGQMLAFEPPCIDAESTIGGVIGCNWAGPRRFHAGAARDHLLGFEAVNGRGECIHGGGRVVKNVTGYDLSKLMCGSFGTLGVLTELCLKVLPRPASEKTLAMQGVTIEQAFNMLVLSGKILTDVTALTYLPETSDALAEINQQVSQINGKTFPTQSVLLIRGQGPEEMLQEMLPHWQSTLLQALSDKNDPTDYEVTFLNSVTSQAAWQVIKNIPSLPIQATNRLWRFSIPATQSSALWKALSQEKTRLLGVDWGGALLWVSADYRCDSNRFHDLARTHGGHARKVKDGSEAAGFPENLPFTPLDAPVEMLHRQIKQGFDPLSLFNVGRIYPTW